MSAGKKKSHGILKVSAIVIVLLIAVIVAIPFVINANQFRPELESEITDALGRQVKVGNLSLSLLSGAIAADDISIADDPAFGQTPFVQAKSLKVGVELAPLIFSRVVHVNSVSLDRPEITLIRSASGDWNFGGIGSKDAKASADKRKTADDRPGPEVTIGRLKVSDGRITVIRRGPLAKPRSYDHVDIEARDLSFTSVMPFSLSAGLPGGGSVRLEGRAGPISRADASLTPVSGTLSIKRLDLLASGFVESDAGLSGVFDFEGSLKSDGRKLESQGSAKAEKLRITKTGSPASKPVSLQYAVIYSIKNKIGDVGDVKVQFGEAVAHMTGSFDMRGETTSVDMKLRGDNMPAQDLQALLPAVGMTLPRGASLEGGILNADLTAEGPVNRLLTTGIVRIDNTRLDGFDLGSKMTAVASLAGIQASSVTEIQKFASQLRLGPDGIQASDIVLIVPSLGQLTGSGVVGGNNALDFKMIARLNTAGGVVGGLSRLAGVKAGSEADIPFFIRGTTSDPKFIPDTKGVAAGLLGGALGGKDAKSGEKGQSLGDTLRDLLKKKKP